jgi:hypothetical protein
MNRWLRWLAPFFLGAVLALPPLWAQSIEVPRGHSALPREASDEGSRTAAFPYAVAAFALIVVMLIVCMPTRKS